MIRVVLLAFVLSIVSSCATCKYCNENCYLERAVPYPQHTDITKAPRPADPKYIILDESKQIYDYDILRNLGYNIVEMKRFLKDMTDLVVYYEKVSDDIKAENQRLKEEAEKAAKEHNDRVRGND